MTIGAVKKAVGAKAAEFIQDGMKVGLGTGTTAACFIHALIKRCQAGLKIQVACTSKKSERLARRGNIPLLNIDEITSLDITVDGADEIDPEKRMIKGGGGALVREKIIASMSREMVVIIDETKQVQKLGAKKLPLEIIQFGHAATIYKLQKLGYRGDLRLKKNGTPYVTDNKNYLFDLHLDPAKTDPKADNERLLQIPGVVDTGFFLGMAGRVVVGFLDGQIVIQ